MDIALTLDKLVPAAQYRGSLTANDKKAYDAIVWLDERPQPSWPEVNAAWPQVQADLNAERAAAEGRRAEQANLVTTLNNIRATLTDFADRIEALEVAVGILQGKTGGGA